MKTRPCSVALLLASSILLCGCNPVTGESTSASSTVSVQEIGDDDLANLAEALTSNHLAVRLEAIKSLGAASLDPNSKKAAQVVQWLLDHRRIEFNDYEDRHVESALRALGPVAVAEVERQALSSEISEVSNACEAMRSLGSEFYASFQPLLTKMLKSDLNEQKWGALYSLEKMGSAGHDLLPLIKPYLTDSDFQLQIIALRALAAMGPSAMTHEDIVRDLTTNGQNVSVKSHALRTLGYISVGDPKQAQAAAEVIGKNLKEFPFATKSRALEGLIQLQANASPTADVIKELLHDQTGLAPQAAVVHGYITGEWEATLQLLISLVRDPVVGMECLDLLGKLGPRAAAAEATFQAMTKDEDEIVALLAVEGLAGLVKADSPAEFEQLNVEQRQLLDRIATHLQKLSTQGELEPHHRATVLVDQWKALGWQPPQPAPPQPKQETPTPQPSPAE